MKKRLLPIVLALALLLASCGQPDASPTPDHIKMRPVVPTASQACTSFCLDNGDHCVFGANQDNTVDRGMLLVKGRHVLKTAWEPGTSGRYARWISKYGSLTFDYAAYQLAWAGMNEAGLMISTMALAETQNPGPDERPPLISPFWMQYQLDNHSTVEEVIASDAQVRIADTVDHYLVCDRKGDCATIEFLDGKMVYHIGESLPVKALTNSIYQESVSAWEDARPWGLQVHWVGPDSAAARAGIKVGDLITAVDDIELDWRQPLMDLLSRYEIGDEVKLTIRRPGDQGVVTVTVTLGSHISEEGEHPSLGPLGISSANSLPRFATAANRLEAFEPTSSQEAIAYAFDTLEAVAGDNTAWRIVFDPANLRVYFRTNRNPQVRFVDLRKLDFSCRIPVMMLDIHADLSGDISSDFWEYSHEASLDHTLNYRIESGMADGYSPFLIEVLLRGVESFPCKEGAASIEAEGGALFEDYAPWLPPTFAWAGLAIVYRFWTVWALLTLLSLALVIWHLMRRKSMSWSKRLVWALVVAVFGPFGLLLYLLVHRKRHRVPKEAGVIS